MVVIVVYAKVLVPLERECMGNFQSAPTNAENHETKNCTHKPTRDVFCRLCVIWLWKQFWETNNTTKWTVDVDHFHLNPKLQTNWSSSLPPKLNLTATCENKPIILMNWLTKESCIPPIVATQSQAILESLPTWSASTFRLEYLDPLGHNIQILTSRWRKCNFSTAYGTNLYRNRQ
jgi:hypothetical protein